MFQRGFTAITKTLIADNADLRGWRKALIRIRVNPRYPRYPRSKSSLSATLPRYTIRDSPMVIRTFRLPLFASTQAYDAKGFRPASWVVRKPCGLPLSINVPPSAR